MTFLPSEYRFCTTCRVMTAHQIDDRIGPTLIRCSFCGHELDQRQERRGLFHHLWTVAAKARGYLKAEWQHLANLCHIDED